MKTDIIYRAIEAFGHGRQWDIVQEECGELVAAVNHYRRRKISADDLASEIADVIIMSEQARIMCGESLVDAAVGRKLRRLAERIEAVKP